MPAPTIYYIRHGETAWNAEGRLQGAQDTSLNDLGRKQAVRAGGILADLFAREGRSEQALAYVASPLGRARSTMELVRGAMKLPRSTIGCARLVTVIGKARRWRKCRPGIPRCLPGVRPTNGRCRRRAARPMPRCRSGRVTGMIRSWWIRSRWLTAARHGR